MLFYERKWKRKIKFIFSICNDIVLELLPGRRLSYVAADIGTNPSASGIARRKSSLAARAIRVMTEMRDNGTIVFIGPDDTCSSEALVAAAWNLPIISYVSAFTITSLFADLLDLVDVLNLMVVPFLVLIILIYN